MKKFSLVLLVLSLIVFSGCSSAQNTDTKNPETNKVTTTTSATSRTPTEESLILCSMPPQATDIGSNEYPIAAKYEKLTKLGQIFTAAPCKAARLNAVFNEVYQGGVEGSVIGSSLTLLKNPDSSLVTTFKNIGYTCSEKAAENECKAWKLEKPVDVNDLLKLEPYVEFFASDDCVNCG